MSGALSFISIKWGRRQPKPTRNFDSAHGRKHKSFKTVDKRARMSTNSHEDIGRSDAHGEVERYDL